MVISVSGGLFLAQFASDHRSPFSDLSVLETDALYLTSSALSDHFSLEVVEVVEDSLFGFL